MTSEVRVENRAVVIPGQELANGMDYLPGEHTYREGDKIFAKILGLANVAGRVIKVTPLAGPYQPKVGDKIIGQVTDITMSGWRIWTNTAYSAMLNVKDATNRFIRRDEDLSKIFAIGDFVVAKITKVTSQNLIDLTMRDPELFKVNGGRVIRINSQKVPRVIGKQGSMVGLIKRYTRCDITVGQNGVILVRGREVDNELLAEQAVKLVAQKAHTSGLTEQVEAFLKERAPEPSAEEMNRQRAPRRERKDEPAPRFERKSRNDDAETSAPKAEEAAPAENKGASE